MLSSMWLLLIIGSFSIDNGDGRENVTFERLFQFPENVKLMM